MPNNNFNTSKDANIYDFHVSFIKFNLKRSKQSIS